MINWKLRLKNKTTLTTLILALLSLVYQILAALNIVPAISQEQAVNIVTLVINALCLLGIVVDPTTKGVADSDRAMEYNELGGDE